MALMTMTIGFVLSLLTVVLLLAVATGVHLVVRRGPDHAGAKLPGPAVPDLRPHREAGAAGPGPHRDPGRDHRPLGRRAAPDRTRPARRRPGAARRPRHEPRHGRRRCSTDDPEAARRLVGRGPGHDRRGPRRPAQRRPRHPPAGAGRPRPCRRGRRHWRSTWRSPSTSTPTCRASAGAGRVGGLLRGRRVPGQRRQALRRRARLDQARRTPTGSCARSSATTVAAAPTRPPAPACWG